MKHPRQFRPAGAPTRQEQKQQADKWRGNASARGYNSRWSKARITHLSRDPICRGCEAEGVIVAATVVDHVDPHHGDPDKFWDTSMWQSCCKWHHDSVKQRLEQLYAHRKATLDDLWLDSPMAVRVARGIRADEA
ncbi:HNH endonuclease [Rhizobium halophytocola]|uniref:5-methylcytosine-specific restriction endonuclease McrA n=1 Tax=Rhizobium halophytocola TaxID=735519 RepID=A0ABS4DVH3_9HYPH|nr:HNH endonuclease [Rhizobium halophytocola]MBP1849682.1 5-methylcytosine-specific restriction endonuclease McrA [Rhizobium halophytocola]